MAVVWDKHTEGGALPDFAGHSDPAAMTYDDSAVSEKEFHD